MCIVEVRAIVCATVLELKRCVVTFSSGGRSETLSQHPSWKPCDSSNSGLATRTLRSFMSRSSRICTASRRRSRRKLPCMHYGGLACCRTWSVSGCLYETHVLNIRRASQIACRLIVQKPLEPATKAKISMFCHVAPEQVIGVHDVSSVYHVPLLLQSQGIVDYLRKRLNLGALTLTQEMKDRGNDLESRWRELTKRYGGKGDVSGSTHLL